MSPHEISTDGTYLTVTGPRQADLDALTERFGKWSKRDSAYHFPHSQEQAVRDILARITPASAVTANPTGWSKASRRRAGRSHPLGEVTYAGDGFTEYEDTEFGGGRVQIWDQS